MIVDCQNCGEPMPPLPDDLAKVLASGASVSLVHETCPGAEPPPPEGRHFEVRVSIVEVEIVAGDAAPEQEELAAFRAGVRAADLSSAMRPLAEALGVEWMKVEKHAGIADPRATAS